ncbi:hypothetical protein AOLI_G00291370 [Acnodon oligacanthus]
MFCHTHSSKQWCCTSSSPAMNYSRASLYMVLNHSQPPRAVDFQEPGTQCEPVRNTLLNHSQPPRAVDFQEPGTQCEPVRNTLLNHSQPPRAVDFQEPGTQCEPVRNTLLNHSQPPRAVDFQEPGTQCEPVRNTRNEWEACWQPARHDVTMGRSLTQHIQTTHGAQCLSYSQPHSQQFCYGVTAFKFSITRSHQGLWTSRNPAHSANLSGTHVSNPPLNCYNNAAAIQSPATVRPLKGETRKQLQPSGGP